MANKFDLVATGGTFDEIHIGHIALLSKAFELGKRVIIGVTSDDFAEKTKGEKKVNHSYDKRVFNLKDIIQKKFGRVSYKISKLDNEYGPIVILGRVDALIASTETAKKGVNNVHHQVYTKKHQKTPKLSSILGVFSLILMNLAISQALRGIGEGYHIGFHTAWVRPTAFSDRVQLL